MTSEDGVTTVFAPGKTAKKLAENQLDGRVMASLATSDNSLFLRTDTALYRLQLPRGAVAPDKPVAVRPTPRTAPNRVMRTEYIAPK